MKILAIRGRNLASLSETFALDFQAEPLASAGLYAITGATGAGKSTLLDALCLALYENTPRLHRASARGVIIPDVGEHGLGPADPRNLLRRGATEGYAEVDFVGSDGAPYRARWSVRRARNATAGRLQNSEVTLRALHGGQLLGGHTKTEVLSRIEQCVGLNFAQFTRAVLLAQNDFSAFLKAADDDRAELLETLTGTEAYSRISMQAHARARRETDLLGALQQRLDQQALMPEDLRRACEEALASERDAVQAGERQVAALEAELRWHQHWALICSREAAARATRDAAHQAHAEAGDRILRLSAIEAVQSARPLDSALVRLESEHRSVTQSLVRTGEALRAATAAAEARQQAVQTAEDMLRRAEDARSALQAELDRARALDAEIRAIAPTHQAAVAANAAARQALALAERRQDELQALSGQHSAALKALQDWFAGKASLRTLAESWPRWEALLARAAELSAEYADGRERCAGVSAETARLAEALARAQADSRARQTELESLGRRLAEALRASAGTELDDWALRRQWLDTRREQLVDAIRLCSRLAELQRESQLLERDQEALAASYARSREQHEAARAALPAARQALSSAEKSLTIARLAASQKVEELRTLLEPDAPCPVCGATAHPYAEHNPELQAVLASLAEQTEGAQQALGTVLQRASAEQARCEAAILRIAELDAEHTRVQQALDSAGRAWAQHPIAGELRSAALGALSGAAPGDPTLWLEAQQDLALAELARIAAQESGYREAQRRRELEQAAVNQGQAAARDAQQQAGALELQHQTAAQSCHTVQQRLGELGLQLKSTLASLDEAFADPGWREAWAADSRRFRADCQAEVVTWQRRQRQLSELGSEIAGREAAQHAAQAALAVALAQLQQQTAQYERLDLDLRARQAERAALFDGLALDAVEAALSLAWSRARAEVASQLAERQSADAERARLDGAVQAGQVQLARLEQDLKQAQRALGEWLAVFAERAKGADASLEALRSLLAFTPDWIQSERGVLLGLERGLAEAQAVLEVHRREHLEHARTRPSAVSPEVLRDTLMQAVASLEDARERHAGVRLELAGDDERRAQAQQLGQNLAEQSARTRVWTQLDELIGSADGRKFRNFAQQLTLDILLAYANRQLESLSRRYRLERIPDSLGLMIVDQDMGDEVRSVHSLSGGESFLVSLALALGLASLSSHRVRVESLFIDEGFGSLDSDALGVAMDALDRLQSQGRKVGVISHVQEMTERISTRIEVQRGAGGLSRVRVAG